uniref:Apple domain-containing protein n=1 Tax=Steinernema glaseri TaxID=37863 RepID=A0A1I7Y544_9BILA
MLHCRIVVPLLIGYLHALVYGDIIGYFVPSQGVEFASLQGTKVLQNVRSAEECMAECLMDESCKGGTYLAFNNVCYLPSELSVGKKTTLWATATSFVKISEEDRSCEKSFEELVQAQSPTQPTAADDPRSWKPFFPFWQ